MTDLTPISTFTSDGISQCVYSITADPARGIVASSSTGVCTTTPSVTLSSTPVTSTPATNPEILTTGSPISNSIASQTSTSISTASSTLPSISQTITGNPPTSTAPVSTGNKGLAGGAVAGVAIGMLLAGALIASIVFFFLLRRQKKRHAMPTYTHQPPSYSRRKAVPEKGTTVAATAMGPADDLLPQPVEDEAIIGELSKIRDNIKNHVRTFYHSEPVSATELNEANIQDIAASTGLSADMLVNSLSDPAKRDRALRAVLAAVILTRTTGDRNPNLLPSELSALSTSVSAQRNDNRECALPRYHTSTDSYKAANLVLVSKWKTITGALLQQRYGKQSQDPGRAHGFQDTVTTLDAVVAPFVKGSVDGGQRRKNLDMILTRAANFAFLLFTQPGSFYFDFASHQGGVTVFPALVQTVGDRGQPLSPMKALAEREEVAA